jgi:hypothetical protein
MDSPTFLKLNRDTRRKISLGLKTSEFTYSPDYMGVRLLPVDESLEKTGTVTWTLPEITVGREYTAVVVVNPALYALGQVNAPVHLPHTGEPVTASITFRGKGEIKLPWLAELRLMA